jgi:hypothetical protein
MVDATWTVLPSLGTWTQLQQQFVVYQAMSVVVFPLIILALLVLFRPAWPFVWARLVTHEPIVCIVDRLTREITPDKRFRKSKGVFYFLSPDPSDPKRHKKFFPEPFIKVYPGNFYFTGLPWDIVDADVKILEDPRFRKACNQLKAEGYANIEALEQAILFTSMTPGKPNNPESFDPRLKEWMNRAGFKTYEEMKAKINPKDYTIDSPIIKQFFTSCQISEFLGYGTDIPESNINGECHDIYESKKPSEAAKRTFQNMLPIIIGIILICAVGAVIVVWLGI